MAGPYVSRSIERTEDPPLLMGRAHFMADLKMAGVLAVKFLRSPHAHARLVDVDVRAALAMPGVEAALTGADLAAVTRPICAVMSGADSRRPPAARGRGSERIPGRS